MKKLLLISYLLSLNSFGQNKIAFHFNLTEMVTRNDSDGFYNGNGLAIGKEFIMSEESSFDICLSYLYSGNLSGLATPTYVFKRHLLGGELAYSFWSREKKVRPFISVALHTEIALNYRNGLLMEDQFKPKDRYSISGDARSARWYKGTPLTGNSFFGFNTRLIPSLYLKTAFGVGYERVKSKSLSWMDGEVENPLEEADKQPMKVSGVFSWNLLVGLRYEFSFKKESKPQ